MWQVYFEIALFVLIAFFIALMILLNVLKRNIRGNTKTTILLVILVLIEVFIAIHFLFCYQIGLPASVTQDNINDLTLTSSDWLSFLGGYLGFAGSLVMAYLVYRQSRIIDEFTISEHKTSASLEIVACAKSTDYTETENYTDTDIIQYIPNIVRESSDKSEPFYTFHCKHDKIEDVEYENFSILIFAEIINNSKSPITNLSFSKIEIRDTNCNRKILCYNNLKGEWDPADNVTQILPGSSLKRCFFLEHIPKTLDISWMTIGFKFDKREDFNTRVLFAKKGGEAMVFLGVS